MVCPNLGGYYYDCTLIPGPKIVPDLVLKYISNDYKPAIKDEMLAFTNDSAFRSRKKYGTGKARGCYTVYKHRRKPLIHSLMMICEI